LIIEEDDFIFEKKDLILFIPLFFILFLILLYGKYKNIFINKLTMIEQMQCVFLFFLTAVACFFVLKKILLHGNSEK
jgi:hypothetical protein